MKRTPVLAAAALCLLQACAGAQGGGPAPPPQAPERDSAAERTIAEAAAMPGYAGHYVENGLLHIGFTPAGMSKAAPLAKRPHVRLFEARHDRAALQSAFDWARRTFQPAQYGPLTFEIDKRRNGVAVGTAFDLTGASPDVACAALKPLPKVEPARGVPILDLRACTR